MFIKTIFNGSKKVKSMRIYVVKCNLYLYFVDITKVANFSREIADVSRTQRVRHLIYIFFGSTLGKV